VPRCTPHLSTTCAEVRPWPRHGAVLPLFKFNLTECLIGHCQKTS
jgi:hypothetical protein